MFKSDVKSSSLLLWDYFDFYTYRILENNKGNERVNEEFVGQLVIDYRSINYHQYSRLISKQV